MKYFQPICLLYTLLWWTFASPATAFEPLDDDLILAAPLNTTNAVFSRLPGLRYKVSRIQTPTPNPGGGYEFDSTGTAEGIMAVPSEIIPATDIAQTWMAWVNPRSLEYISTFSVSHPHTVMMGTSNGAWAGFIEIFNGKPRFSWYNGSTYHSVTGTTTLVSGTWYHLCGRSTAAGQGELFVNGVSQGTVNGTAVRLAMDQFRIGHRGGTNYRTFDGAVRDVRIYRRALTNAEIASAATAPTTLVAGAYDLNNLAIGMPLNLESAAFDGSTRVRHSVAVTASPDAITTGGYSFSASAHDGFTVNLANPITTVSQTWMAWIKASTLTESPDYTTSHPETIMMSGGPAWNGYLRIFNRHPTYSYYNGTSWSGVTATDALTTNTWYHLCGRNDANGSITLFINGRPAISSSTGLTNRQAITLLYVGSLAGALPRSFNGIIQDVRLYTRALSDAEILAMATLPTLRIAGEYLAPANNVVIDYLPPWREEYVGSPAIVILPDGRYVAAHDHFGDGSSGNRVKVFRSDDCGASWYETTTLSGYYHCSLFVHEGVLYLMGPRNGNVTIARSTDGGETWTTPSDAAHGLLVPIPPSHASAPVPVIEYNGRLWRSVENMDPNLGWPEYFRAFVMSAPVGSDLLDAANWRMSNIITFNSAWCPSSWKAANAGWLEGNMIITPDNKLINFLRVNAEPAAGYSAVDVSHTAARMDITDDGTTTTASFDPGTGFVDFPGGHTKFTIRHDPVTNRYWTLVNKVTYAGNPHQRNILMLNSSPDLQSWTEERTILNVPEPNDTLAWSSWKIGFQYTDWVFDGADMVAAIRTSFNDAHTYHDANYLTFMRVPEFWSSYVPVELSQFNLD